MKINDLRIGNYVMDSDEARNIGKVSLIAPNYIYLTITSEVTRGIDEIQGIPLTEEWLIKLGFYEDKTYFHQWSNDWCTIDMSDMQKPEFLCSGLFPAPCEYVHQLQNLYYSIVGEELLVKSVIK